MKAKTNEIRSRPYLVLNRVFAVVICSVFLYSIFNSPEKDLYPVPSGSHLFFGKDSPSSGLSRSFSAIVRFDFRNAERYNPHGVRIFLFFLAQLFMRLAGLLLAPHMGGRALTALYIADSLVSISLFLLCFWPFFSFQLSAV